MSSVATSSISNGSNSSSGDATLKRKAPEEEDSKEQSSSSIREPSHLSIMTPELLPKKVFVNITVGRFTICTKFYCQASLDSCTETDHHYTKFELNCDKLEELLKEETISDLKKDDKEWLALDFSTITFGSVLSDMTDETFEEQPFYCDVSDGFGTGFFDISAYERLDQSDSEEEEEEDAVVGGKLGKCMKLLVFVPFSYNDGGEEDYPCIDNTPFEEAIRLVYNFKGDFKYRKCGEDGDQTTSVHDEYPVPEIDKEYIGRKTFFYNYRFDDVAGHIKNNLPSSSSTSSNKKKKLKKA